MLCSVWTMHLFRTMLNVVFCVDDAYLSQAQDSWFQRKCRLVNHSTSALSYLLPSFLAFSSEGQWAIIMVVCAGIYRLFLALSG